MHGLRDLMVVNLKQDEVIIWFPKKLNTHYKILVNSIDVTENNLKCEFSMIATEGVGDFTILLDNSNRIYSFSADDVIEVYIDNSSATTLVFKGKLENIKKKLSNGSQLELSGWHVASDIVNVTVTKTYANENVSTIVTELFNTYLPNYTTTNVTAIAKTFTQSWEHVYLLDCLIDICNATDTDFYIDNDLDVHFFAKESINNDIEAILERDTLIKEDGLSDTQEQLKTKIVVYGDTVDDIPIIYTKKDLTVTLYREKIIKDDNIKSIAEAKERAESEYTILHNPITQGKATCFGLSQLNPGEMVYVDIPTQDILARYRVAKITHIIGANVDLFYKCDVYLDKEPKALQHLFKDRIKIERETQRSVNSNQMSYSYILPFDASSEADTLSNTAISDGRLKLTSSTGNMVSVKHESPNTITDIEIRVSGNDHIVAETLNIEVSCDNGVSWTTISNVGIKGYSGTKQTIATAKQGKKLKIKITLTEDATYTTPELETVAVLYNT